jgi:dienelactone hydrolase
MKYVRGLALLLACSSGLAFAQNENAKKFGARESIEDISLSPNGKQVAYLQPIAGRGTALYVADVEGGKAPILVLASDAKPMRMENCDWVSNVRLVCKFFAISASDGALLGFTRLIAVNTDGKEFKALGQRATSRTMGINQFDASVIGWPPGDIGDVLMTRNYLPEKTIGTNLASSEEGLGVDRVNTLTLTRSRVESPKRGVSEYIADTNGAVRIMGTSESGSSGYLTGITRYFYRKPDEKAWRPFSKVGVDRNGLSPVAVDSKLNVAFAFDKKDGRMALYKVNLGDSPQAELVVAADKVDVVEALTLGRSGRVIGADIVTDKRYSEIFDPEYKLLSERLSKALVGNLQVRFVGASRDENQLLLSTASDIDPGTYYVFNKLTKHLNKIVLARPELENTTLATVEPIAYPAADGTMIPGYLTLPPHSSGKGLPTIIMPHGGPASRDEWGFDWIAQFFAAQGFAVLQPNFRGSAGYGDSWYVDNGFKSWRIAVQDVNDAANWAIARGTSDRSKMAIFGWSYGGYAALQSNVMNPDLFKAVIAVAPVTDLARLKEDAREFTNYTLVADYVGAGEHIVTGSPRRQAALFKAPVLMFSGDIDLNVSVTQAKAMDAALKENGKTSQLVVYPGLDHQLVDSQIRADLLEKSSDFLRQALALP